VIIRGSHNIDPSLVEEAFLARPAVAMCAVVGEPDAHAGEVPVAFVTLKPGAAATPSEMLAAVTPSVYEPPAVRDPPHTFGGTRIRPSTPARSCTWALRRWTERRSPSQVFTT